MIIINCENKLISETIENLLIKNSISFSFHDTPYSFLKIIINKNNDKIFFTYGKEFKNFDTPININDLNKEFSNLLNKFEINFYNADYFPFQNKIVYAQKTLYLKNIHSIILYNLVLYKDGIEKEILYRLIWPKDKDISINKLDSHLTNLKNYISESIGINIKFQSNKKIIRLVIN